MSAQRGPGFSLSSRGWVLVAEPGEAVRPVFGPEPRTVARALVKQVRDAEVTTGRAHVLCGLIPFDLARPAELLLTDRAVFRPRTTSAPDPARGAGAPAAPDDPRFRLAVARALQAIGDGHVDKVVLSRTAEFVPDDRYDPPDLARLLCERLSRANPVADVFSCPDARGSIWVGASPEVVADVRGGRFLTHPLAGSLPRTIARGEAERRLTSSDKDLREHAFVVRHIIDALADLTVAFDAPDVPALFSTDTMLHLGSRISGDLRPGISALEAAVAIHPTPAVCGTPSASAEALIRGVEPRPRDFYSGLVGWCDGSGDGRWSLVLRGACLSAGCVRLQAGAGIVAGSDPEAEHAETGAKLGTVLGSLDGLVRVG